MKISRWLCVLALILSFVTFVGCAVEGPATTTAAASTTGPTTTFDIATKMSAELAAELSESDENDLLTYFVFLGEINFDELAFGLLLYDIVEDIYNDETRFLAHMANLYGNDTAKIELERDRYARLRLQVIAAITKNDIDAFCADNGIDASQIVYQGKYTMTLILETDAATLRQIAADARAESLDLYQEDIQITEG
ncbi:MAG: hypothetical protein Q8N15_04580 [Bacillota bacterium]|nr:hypothetical protein [Bacillota bacterium]